MSSFPWLVSTYFHYHYISYDIWLMKGYGINNRSKGDRTTVLTQGIKDRAAGTSLSRWVKKQMCQNPLQYPSWQLYDYVMFNFVFFTSPNTQFTPCKICSFCRQILVLALFCYNLFVQWFYFWFLFLLFLYDFFYYYYLSLQAVIRFVLLYNEKYAICK